MIATCRRIWKGSASDLRRIRNAALAMLGIALVLSLCTTGLAQTNATTTIVGTAHDFSTVDGPGYKVPATDNHCEVCHGPPVLGGASYPEWRHAASSSTDYDGANWTYAIGDGLDAAGNPLDIDGDGANDPTMTAGWMTTDCMGCHEGDIAVNDYTGTPALDLYGTDPAITDDGVFVADPWGTDMSVHHPVDITYDAVLAAAQGALEDPALFQNPQGGGSIADTLLDGGKLNCKSCHEQHNDRRFDLIGFDPSDDPEPGATSAEHKFLKLDRLCFVCHTHSQPNDGKQHHIPGRLDPFGDQRGSDMNCDLCHRINSGVTGIADDAGGGYAACSDCHFRGIWRDVASPGTDGIYGTADDVAQPGAVSFPGGHHGGDRDAPYFDCAGCHADPLTGVLTGNDFGTEEAPSCFECHDDVWTNENDKPPTGVSVVEAVDHDADPSTPDRATGTVNTALNLTAVVTGNDDGEILAYQWNFGDGSAPSMPSHDPTISHMYDTTTYSRNPLYQASVAVTDGVNPPVVYEFEVQIDSADEHVADTWAVDVAPTTPATPDFNITFENHSGSLVGTTDAGQLSFGIEFTGVIFWMDLWMDLNDDAFWGTGDMYFGNISRGNGSTVSDGAMDGVLFRPDGTIDTFSASGGAPAGH